MAIVTLSLLNSPGGSFCKIAVKAVILLEAAVAQFLFVGHSDFIPVKKLW
jgi:hypothetical protein